MFGPRLKLIACADTAVIVEIKRIESGKGNATTIGTNTRRINTIQQLRAFGTLQKP